VEKTIDNIIEDMMHFGDQLVPYNYPQADPRLEEELFILKAREAIVDGYAVLLYYNKSDYKNYFIESLQIHSKTSPFLPFNLIVKVAKKFLGGHNLALSEILRDNKKIYCWTALMDTSGRPMPTLNKESQLCNFEGFKYSYISIKNLDIY
jgi:hypothetical protein